MFNVPYRHHCCTTFMQKKIFRHTSISADSYLQKFILDHWSKFTSVDDKTWLFKTPQQREFEAAGSRKQRKIISFANPKDSVRLGVNNQYKQRMTSSTWRLMVNDRAMSLYSLQIFFKLNLMFFSLYFVYSHQYCKCQTFWSKVIAFFSVHWIVGLELSLMTTHRTDRSFHNLFNQFQLWFITVSHCHESFEMCIHL